MLIKALSVIIGLSGTIALSETMSFSTEKTAYANSMTSFIFCVFAIYLLHSVYQKIELTDGNRSCSGRGLSGLYSFGLAFALTVGKQLQTVENFAVGNPLLWLQIGVLTVFFWGFVWYILQRLSGEWNAENVHRGEKQSEGETKAILSVSKKSRIKSFLLTWLIIFLCWIPVFLAFYPGAFVYDAQDEYVQVATRTFSTHHPLTHVLLLGGFVCLGNKFFDSYNVGIAMYTIFQMFVLSGIFAYTISYLKTKISQNACVAITLFYGLFPVIPMYAVCSAKDTLFNGAFLLMLVQMLKVSEVIWATGEDSVLQNAESLTVKEILMKRCTTIKFDIALLILSTAGMMLLRNNGVYAVLLLIAGMALACLITKKNRSVLLVFMIFLTTGFLLYKGVDKTLTVVLRADDSESQELLTVPIQQLARTYKYSPEVFSEEEKELLFSYIPEDILRIYDADLSDLVKANFNNEKYAEDSAAFNGLWLRTFFKKPVTYLNAWFMTSYGYWYPDTIINVYGGQQRFTFQYGDSSYFGFETEQPGTRESKFPWLEEQYRRMSLELYQQNVPGISMAFSPGFLFWVFLGCFVSCIYQKKREWILPMVSILLIWGTVIAGPTFLVRYVLILWFALPVILAAGVLKNGKLYKNNNYES